MLEVGRWSLETVCRDRHSRRGRGSWPLEESHRTRTDVGDRSTGHVYHHKSKHLVSTPLGRGKRAGTCGVTFMGASSSSRMGCEMKISRALVHRYLISVSNSCTCLPGLLPRTSNSLSMIESRSISVSAIAVARYWLGCGNGKKACGRGCASRGVRERVSAGGGCVVILCARVLVRCFGKRGVGHRKISRPGARWHGRAGGEVRHQMAGALLR